MEPSKKPPSGRSLTSSAVSLQIKMLERELGIKLFEHAGRKLVLTPKGESLYEDAQRILGSIREAIERTIAKTGEFTGRISMVAPACLRNFYLPAIARFREILRIKTQFSFHLGCKKSVY